MLRHIKQRVRITMPMANFNVSTRGDFKYKDALNINSHAKTTTKLLADLEHEFWLLRHPVRVGSADAQHERHLPIPGREGIRTGRAVAGRATDRVAGTAHHRLRQ